MRTLFGIGLGLFTGKIVLKAILEHKKRKEYEEEYNQLKSMVDEINEEYYETIIATGMNGQQIEVLIKA